MATKKNPATIIESLFNAQEELNALKSKQQKELESITAKVQELESEVFECFQSELKKSEGTETIEQLGFSVKISRPVKYELKEDSYRELAKSLPNHLQFHRTKLELDKKKYSSLLTMSEGPEIKRYISKIQDCVETKPGKISVEINKIEG